MSAPVGIDADSNVLSSSSAVSARSANSGLGVGEIVAELFQGIQGSALAGFPEPGKFLCSLILRTHVARYVTEVCFKVSKGA